MERRRPNGYRFDIHGLDGFGIHPSSAAMGDRVHEAENKEVIQ